MTSIFDAILSEADLETAIIVTINTWIPTYLAEIERQAGLPAGQLTVPNTVAAAFDLNNWSEYQSPSIIVVTGPMGIPERAGGDRYTAVYPVTVGAFLSGQKEPEVRATAQRYIAAVAALLVQNGSLGTFAATETLMIGRHVELPDPENRTLARGVVELHVTVDSILTGAAGPAAPDPAASTQYTGSPTSPFTAWPEVETLDLAVNGEAL